MDTDFLTREAYQVLIVRSGTVSEFLRSEIGAAASRYPNEDSYLNAMHELVVAVSEAPEEYLDQWNLLEEINSDEFAALVANLADEIAVVIRTPKENRGPTDE